MTMMTATDLPEDPKGPPNLRRIAAWSLLALSMTVLAATLVTNPAEARSCTGLAALEAPLLPATV